MLAEWSELFEQCWDFELSVTVRNATFVQTSQGKLQLLSLGGVTSNVNHALATCQVKDCNQRGVTYWLPDETAYEINIYTEG